MQILLTETFNRGTWSSRKPTESHKMPRFGRSLPLPFNLAFPSSKVPNIYMITSVMGPFPSSTSRTGRPNTVTSSFLWSNPICRRMVAWRSL
jgi:hypothetical protein